MAQTARGRRLMGDINVVPYIDVMLVLLIIFMITAPLLTQGVKVDLPKAGAEALNSPKNPLILSIDRTGNLYLNNGSHPRSPLTADVIEARTAAALKRDPDTPILVHGDASVAYGRVVQAMVILQRAGAKKIGFVTDPLPQPTRRAN
jgi:biopolymer transport protein TolR